MITKTVPNVSSALEGIQSGMTLMLGGFGLCGIPENLIKTITISDRRQAIKTACKFSEAGDILLIAGKGHENYQEINGEQFYFYDLEEVKKYFNLLKK